jgi:hypothetical protein
MQTTNPTTDDGFTAVSCVSTRFCMAVGNLVEGSGSAPFAEMWNGSAWSSLTMPIGGDGTYESMNGVSCTAVDFCMATAVAPATYDTDAVVTDMWDGTKWSDVAIAGTTSLAFLSQVSCVSSTFCMDVASEDPSATAWQWDGSSWAPASTPALATATFSGLSCSSIDFCAMVGVGPNGAVEEDWNGSTWASMPSAPAVPGGSVLSSISCPNDTFCLAVGSSRAGGPIFAEEWDGAAWSVTPTTGPLLSTAGELTGVSCASRTFCMAVGDGDGLAPAQSFAEQWDGSTWTVSTTAYDPLAEISLAGVSCGAVGSCITVGTQQPPYDPVAALAGDQTIAERFAPPR